MVPKVYTNDRKTCGMIFTTKCLVQYPATTIHFLTVCLSESFKNGHEEDCATEDDKDYNCYKFDGTDDLQSSFKFKHGGPSLWHHPVKDFFRLTLHKIQVYAAFLSLLSCLRT